MEKKIYQLEKEEVFKQVESQVDGLNDESVKQNGLWGAIDSRGQIAVSPSYNLETNILIEFIGKWHIGEDLNLYYFTDK